MKILACVWCECHWCKAPNLRPLPAGWSYTVKQMPHGIDQVTPHTEDCIYRFKKVEIPDVDD